MEQTIAWLVLLGLAVLLAVRRVRPEIPAAAVLLLALVWGYIDVRDASSGLGHPGLLLLVILSMLAREMSVVIRALLRRWRARAPRVPLAQLTVLALAASAVGQGTRVLRDVGSAATTAQASISADDAARDLKTRIVLVHACLLGGLLCVLGNAVYPLVGWFGLFGLAPIALAAAAASALAGITWLRGTIELPVDAREGDGDQTGADGGPAITAGLISLGWLLLVVIRFVYGAEDFIIGWLLQILCDVLPVAVGAFVLLRGRRHPVVVRGLMLALALVMALLLDVPLIVAFGGAALVLLALSTSLTESPAIGMDWGFPLLFALLWPLSAGFANSGMAADMAVNVALPVLEASGPTVLLCAWMLAVMCFANACGAIFTLAVFLPIGAATAGIAGIDPRPFVSLLVVGAAAASVAPDLWGKRLAELEIDPVANRGPLLLVQCLILVVSVPVVLLLFDIG